MRTLSPNLDREDGLDTILEVPFPKETLITVRGNTSKKSTGCTNLKSWVRPQTDHRHSYTGRGIELQLLLGVIGAPLIPLPVIPSTESLVLRHNKNDPLEVSTAKYIVQQYIAASGGEKVLSSKGSMYAMGKVRMMASDFCPGVNKKATAKERAVGGELGGFVLWQKKPDMWCLELVVSGCKISAGSNGKVAWRQTPWQQSHASRGPPRPLRRLLQGLDPLSTADLFSNASCIGEKTVHGEDCFVLRLDARASTLRARSSISIEIIRHTLWGCFSQRTGLLVQLEDTQLLKISSGTGEESIYWETTMESTMEDYRPVDGIIIAHSGRTATTLFRFSDAANGNTRTLMEEWWTVEEVDFNIWGLSMDCFLPPGDLKEERESRDVLTKNDRPLPAVQASAIKIRPSKVAAVDNDDSSL